MSEVELINAFRPYVGTGSGGATPSIYPERTYTLGEKTPLTGALYKSPRGQALDEAEVTRSDAFREFLANRAAKRTFKDGGVVPGPEDAPIDITAHGGEVVLNKSQLHGLNLDNMVDFARTPAGRDIIRRIGG